MAKNENEITEEIAAELAWLILHGGDSGEILIPESTDDVDYKFVLDENFYRQAGMSGGVKSFDT